MKYSLATLMGSSIFDKKLDINDCILHHKENVDIIPSNLDLSILEVNLVNAMSREYILRNCIIDLKKL